MLISTRELEQMLPVDVRVQIKALGPQGWVPCSPLARLFPSEPAPNSHYDDTSSCPSFR
jgi:hypothetical protein